MLCFFGSGIALLLIAGLIIMHHEMKSNDPVSVLRDDMPKDVAGIICMRPGPLLSSPIIKDLSALVRDRNVIPSTQRDLIAELRRLTMIDLEHDVDWICGGFTESKMAYLLVHGQFNDLGKDALEQQVDGYTVYTRHNISIVVLDHKLIGFAPDIGWINRLIQTANGSAPSVADNHSLSSMLDSIDVAHTLWGVYILPSTLIGDQNVLIKSFLKSVAQMQSVIFNLDCLDSLRLSVQCISPDAPSTSKIFAGANQLLGLARLFSTRDHELQDILNAITIRQDENRVMIQAELHRDVILAAARKNSQYIGTYLGRFMPLTK